MIILSIETSCDETGVAIIENGTTIRANQLASQIKDHAPYGGVIPETAARLHVECIHYLIKKALDEAALDFSDLDACAVTMGPGLEGALLVGIVVTKTMGEFLKIPVIGVNHLHGHLYSTFLSDKTPEFPCVTLIASGGHTMLVHVKDHGDYTCIGNTRDDACGEAFDKVARVLGLAYPGGPSIEKAAKEGNPSAYKFPRAMLGKGLDFSFSGLKTAVVQQVQHHEQEGHELPVADIAASFQQCVADILMKKSLLACDETGVNQLVLCGGVTANQTIMKTIQKAAEKQRIAVTVPPIALCTDNGAMIGAAAYYKWRYHKDKIGDFTVTPNLDIGVI